MQVLAGMDGQLGLNYYFIKNLFLGFAVQYTYQNANLQGSGVTIDGNYIEIPIYFGVAL